ncbi:polyphosphate kinase 1 [Bacteroidota bacterium]
MSEIFNNKEISWLYFNERVLQEAENEEVPLLERIRFLGIYSNNLDEFFRVRVATLKRLSKLGKKTKTIIGDDPNQLLKEIHQIVLTLRNRFDESYKQIRKSLEKENFFIINEKELDEEQGKFVQNYFHSVVRPKLIPIMLGQSEDFPALKDDAIYLAISLIKNTSSKAKYSLIQIPSHVLPRFLVLPDKGRNKYIILLDDVIRYGLNDIFYIFDFDEITAHTIKLTKDAELDISDDLSESVIRKVSNSLKKRKEGEPVRFVFDQDIKKEFLDYLTSRLNFKTEDAIIPGGRYHNFKDFMNFPLVGKEYRYEPMPPVPHPEISFHQSILTTIKKKDVMLYFPYHSFDIFIDLLREASIDPKVTEIKITLYRLAKNSSVINALINAARNGKAVTAVVELQARFDEEANIIWSERLKDEGVRVIYGVHDLKVHAKLCLINRREKKDILSYACIGTGNFNEDTTSIFSDLLLFTFNQKITSEVNRVFEFFEKNYKIGVFRHLMLSPFYFRSRMVRMIENEINNARDGKKAVITFKLNNLVDDEIIKKLYEAAMAGVQVRLNIRGMFSLLPNLPELRNNIETMAIIDRFLEHTRIFVFHNNGDEKYFISSADLMRRNLDYRVEVICPIYDKEIQQELKTFLDIQWKDNTKARILNNDFSNDDREIGRGENIIRSQFEFYNYLKQKTSD